MTLACQGYDSLHPIWFPCPFLQVASRSQTPETVPKGLAGLGEGKLGDPLHQSMTGQQLQQMGSVTGQQMQHLQQMGSVSGQQLGSMMEGDVTMAASQTVCRSCIRAYSLCTFWHYLSDGMRDHA